MLSKEMLIEMQMDRSRESMNGFLARRQVYQMQKVKNAVRRASTFVMRATRGTKRGTTRQTGLGEPSMMPDAEQSMSADAIREHDGH